jgi:hypothetical protein
MPINGVDPYAIAFVAMPLAFFAARWATNRQNEQGLTRLMFFLVVFYLASMLFTGVGMLLVGLLPEGVITTGRWRGASPGLLTIAILSSATTGAGKMPSASLIFCLSCSGPSSWDHTWAEVMP